MNLGTYVELLKDENNILRKRLEFLEKINIESSLEERLKDEKNRLIEECKEKDEEIKKLTHENESLKHDIAELKKCCRHIENKKDVEFIALKNQLVEKENEITSLNNVITGQVKLIGTLNEKLENMVDRKWLENYATPKNPIPESVVQFPIDTVEKCVERLTERDEEEEPIDDSFEQLEFPVEDVEEEDTPEETEVVPITPTINTEMESTINFDIEDDFPKTSSKWKNKGFLNNRIIYNANKNVEAVNKHFSKKFLKLVEDHFNTDMDYKALSKKYKYTKNSIGVTLTRYMNELKTYINDPDNFIFEDHTRQHSEISNKNLIHREKGANCKMVTPGYLENRELYINHNDVDLINNRFTEDQLKYINEYFTTDESRTDIAEKYNVTPLQLSGKVRDYISFVKRYIEEGPEFLEKYWDRRNEKELYTKYRTLYKRYRGVAFITSMDNIKQSILNMRYDKGLSILQISDELQLPEGRIHSVCDEFEEEYKTLLAEV